MRDPRSCPTSKCISESRGIPSARRHSNMRRRSPRFRAAARQIVRPELLDGKLLPMLTFLAINPVAGWLAALAFAIIAAIAAYSGLSIADCTIIALLLGLGTLGAASLYQTSRSLDAVQQTILCVGIGLILTVMFAQAEDGPWLGSGLLSAPAAAAQHHCHPNHQGSKQSRSCARTVARTSVAGAAYIASRSGN